MKKAKLNTRLAIAGALFSGILMMVAVFGFTSETVVDSNNNIEAIQLADNSMGDLVIFDGKCGGDEKAKEGDKEKKEGKCGEGKCGDDKAKAKEGEKEGKCGEGKCGGDEKAKEGEKEGEKEGKCGEGKCGEGKCGGDDKAKEGDKKESKCGEGKCGK